MSYNPTDLGAACSTNTNYTTTGTTAIDSFPVPSQPPAIMDLGGMIASISLPNLTTELVKQRYTTYIGSIFTIFEIAGTSATIPFAHDGRNIRLNVRNGVYNSNQTIGGIGDTYSYTFQYRGVQLNNNFSTHLYELISEVQT